MAQINEAVERGIQKLLARAKGKIVDDAVIYSIFGPYETIRYIDGAKHLTGGCGLEFVSEPWYYWYSTIARDLFAPKGVVVSFDDPVCWDNETTPIPEDELRIILSRIEQSFGTRYKGCRFVLKPPKAQKEIA